MTSQIDFQVYPGKGDINEIIQKIIITSTFYYYSKIYYYFGIGSWDFYILGLGTLRFWKAYIFQNF